MTGTSWLVDSKRIAKKIKNAAEKVDPSRFQWTSNPTKACPRCNHIIDNSDVVQEWPGLPRGVKFDPSDQELIWHLQAKVGKGDTEPHPFINEFIPTVYEDDGICYTHPQKLPGVKQDGSVSHFFHRTFKAYNTGTRKRRKIHSDVLGGDVRWHKTGKTKPVIVDGIHVGCKKIMVLYMNTVKGEKPEKTNWVMHQYHLGTGEDEKDGEYVVSKIFHQQQPRPGDNRTGEDLTTTLVETMEAASVKQLTEAIVHHNGFALLNSAHQVADKQHPEQMAAQARMDHEITTDENISAGQDPLQKFDDQDGHPPTGEDIKWWEGESQFLLDSQQLAEGIALCDEFLRSQSQSSCGVGDGGDEAKRSRPCLSDYARIGGVDLKKDLEECQNLGRENFGDPHAYTEQLDTPPDMRLSQLEFGSQDNF